MGIFKIVGILLIVFGLVDLIGSFLGFDLWGTIGIQSPEIVWRYSSYIEIVAGYVIMNLGGSDDDEAAEE